MAEHASDVLTRGVMAVGGGGEDRRNVPAFVVTEPATASSCYYTTDAAVPAAGAVIGRGVQALVWQGSAAASVAANATTFDRSTTRWTTFTLVGAGGHYIAPSAQIPTIAGANEIVGLTYIIRTTARRWQITTPPTPPPPTVIVITSSLSGPWAISAASTTWHIVGTVMQAFDPGSDVAQNPVTLEPLWVDMSYADPVLTTASFGFPPNTPSLTPWAPAAISQLQTGEGFIPLAGSDIIWNTNPPIGTGTHLGTSSPPASVFRQLFSLRTGTVLSATFEQVTNGSLRNIYLNNHGIGDNSTIWLPAPSGSAPPPVGTTRWESSDATPPSVTTPVNPAHFLPGAPNILAIHSRVAKTSFSDPPDIYEIVDGGAAWRLVITFAP